MSVSNNTIKMLLNVFLLVAAADFIFVKVHTSPYPKDFFMPDEFQFDDNNFEEKKNHFHHHHHHHHHHHDVKEYDVEDQESTLVMSHVLFRHGNRTPDSIQELYPNDPYLNETYYPYGLGQLTNAGKLREYSIGTSLRQRYNSFLKEMYVPAEVEAYSTDYNRTKASLQLVLAGLFPPQKEQVWNNGLMWQPVPYNFLSRSEDRILLGVLCPNYVNLYEKISRSLEMTSQFNEFEEVFGYISENSGLNVTRFQDIYNLYFGLSTEEENGLPLPQWTQEVWPKTIVDLAIKEYYVAMAHEDLKKMAAGYFLEKIIQDTLLKIYGNANDKKIYLYSAHENNVAEFLMLLDVFRPHIPNYGAHVLVEVHRINGVFGIKIFYQNYESDEPELMKMPNCEEFCPFEQFIQLFRKFIPNNDLCGN